MVGLAKANRPDSVDYMIDAYKCGKCDEDIMKHFSTQCGHIFHRACLYQWSDTRNKASGRFVNVEFPCPLCKRNVTLLYPANYFPEIDESSLKKDSEDDTIKQQAKHFKDLGIHYLISAFLVRFPKDTEILLKCKEPKEFIDYLLKKCADDEAFCKSLSLLDPNCSPNDLLVPLHKKFPEIMGAIIKKDNCGVCCYPLVEKDIKPYLGRYVTANQKFYHPDCAPSSSEGKRREGVTAYAFHFLPKPNVVHTVYVPQNNDANVAINVDQPADGAIGPRIAYVPIPDQDDENAVINVDQLGAGAINPERARRICGIFKRSTTMFATGSLLMVGCASLNLLYAGTDSQEKIALITTGILVFGISAIVLVELGRRLRDRGL